jgi:hypothetical protein
VSFEAGRDFVFREARVLEQRLFATLFKGAPAAGVFDALRAHRNDDGGFGHGLEPDKRCPDSQPLDVSFAFKAMDTAGTLDPDLARGACDFLATIGPGLPVVLPSVAAYPRANHWESADFPPTLNPTCGIAGLLWKHGIEHPWRDAATAWCLGQLEHEPLDDAHAIEDVLLFCEHAPGGEAWWANVAGRLREARYFRADPDDPEYGLTPLVFAPDPASRGRELFSDDEIERHLDALEREQQDDGGWPLSWEPPSRASSLEWRGIRTVWALRVLRAYGRVAAAT